MESKCQSTCLTVQAEPVRDLRTITDEICYIRDRANQVVLESAIQIGLRLQEAKAQLPHGEWGAWLKEQVHFSQSTAGNLMRLAEEYGTGQVSLFGRSANSQTLGNLPYTKALKLLSLPAEERDDFVEQNDVAAMSTRALEKAIRERDEARTAEQKARARAEQAEHYEAQAKQAQTRAMQAEDTAKQLIQKLADMESQRDRAQSDAQAARSRAEQLEQHPEIPAEMLESLKAEAERSARSTVEAEAKAANEQALADLRRKLETAEAQKVLAEQAAQEATVRAEALRKQSEQANPDVIRFKAQFERVQRELQQLRTLLNAIRESDADTAAKLTRAMEALVRQYGGNA